MLEISSFLQVCLNLVLVGSIMSSNSMRCRISKRKKMKKIRKISMLVPATTIATKAFGSNISTRRRYMQYQMFLFVHVHQKPKESNPSKVTQYLVRQTKHKVMLT